MIPLHPFAHGHRYTFVSSIKGADIYISDLGNYIGVEGPMTSSQWHCHWRVMMGGENKNPEMDCADPDIIAYCQAHHNLMS